MNLAFDMPWACASKTMWSGPKGQRTNSRIHAKSMTRAEHKNETRNLFTRLLLPVLMHSIATDGTCQSIPDSTAFAKNTIFASALGNGLLYSVNWDRCWHIHSTRWISLSGGLTFLPGSDYPTNFSKISVPFQFNYFRGRDHHREHGFGLTYGRGWYTGSTNFGEPLASQGIYLFIKPIGYRYQPIKGGFFFRLNLLAWSRVIEFNRKYVEEYGYWETPPIFPWMGLDLGYTFRPRKTGTR